MTWDNLESTSFSGIIVPFLIAVAGQLVEMEIDAKQKEIQSKYEVKLIIHFNPFE